MKRTYQPGELCIACGNTRADIRRHQFECGVYGARRGKHTYNKEALQAEESRFPF